MSDMFYWQWGTETTFKSLAISITLKSLIGKLYKSQILLT
jgi:hypothetical protein